MKSRLKARDYPQKALAPNPDSGYMLLIQLTGTLAMDKMTAPTFTLAEVATAAGTKSTTLRQWLFRDWFKLDSSDAPAHTPGATTLVTGRTALAMGVAVHLGGSVVPLEMAMKAAVQFAYSGSDESEEANGFVRRPGEIFDGAEVTDTLAVFSRGEGRNDWETAIVPKIDGMKLEDCINSGSYGINSLETLIICPLTSTVHALRTKLDLHK